VPESTWYLTALALALTLLALRERPASEVDEESGGGGGAAKTGVEQVVELRAVSVDELSAATIGDGCPLEEHSPLMPLSLPFTLSSADATAACALVDSSTRDTVENLPRSEHSLLDSAVDDGLSGGLHPLVLFDVLPSSSSKSPTKRQPRKKSVGAPDSEQPARRSLRSAAKRQA